MTNLTAKILTLTGLVLLVAGCAANAESDYPGDYHGIIYDEQGRAVTRHCGHCLRLPWMTDRETCEPQQSMSDCREARRAAELTQEERTVYFDFDRANLTPEAKERLDTLATVLKSDQSVKEAKIVGYADRIGSDSYNEKLSQRRAEAVRDYLIASGITTTRDTETRWVGESEPSTNCPAEARPELIACLRNDRRAEVVVEFFPERQRSDAR